MAATHSGSNAPSTGRGPTLQGSPQFERKRLHAATTLKESQTAFPLRDRTRTSIAEWKTYDMKRKSRKKYK